MERRTKTSKKRKPRSAPSVQIRLMELADLPPVFELGQKLFTAEKLPTLYRSWDDDEVLELFGSDGETCLVAEVDGRLVGFALGAMMEKPRNAWRYGWLEWLGIEPHYKRHGVASRLLARLTEMFIERDARIMLVDTDEGNADALAFFRKKGFNHETKHIYLSYNLTSHPQYREHKEAQD
ncbi:MAG: GNAT family N-acetyltransferase [Verrucomicrobiae bacterium]|nr:GNAT family N-acetyltransferase [Verrucomicrobiae bacterium]